MSSLATDLTAYMRKYSSYALSGITTPIFKPSATRVSDYVQVDVFTSQKYRLRPNSGTRVYTNAQNFGRYLFFPVFRASDVTHTPCCTRFQVTVAGIHLCT